MFRPCPLRELVGLGEELRRLEVVGGQVVLADTDDLVAGGGDHLLHECHRVGGRLGLVDGDDEVAAHTEVGLGGPDPVDDAVDAGVVGDAVGVVVRRVEEHLAVAEVAEAHLVLEGLVGDPGEVLAVDDRAGDGDVGDEELDDAVEVVQLGRVVGRQRHGVLLGELYRRVAGRSLRGGSAAPPWGCGGGTRRDRSWRPPGGVRRWATGRPSPFFARVRDRERGGGSVRSGTSPYLRCPAGMRMATRVTR